MPNTTHYKDKTLSTLQINQHTYHYYNITKLNQTLPRLAQLPFSLKILLENLLRHEDGVTVSQHDIHAFDKWLDTGHTTHEIAYYPARVLMQDFTGVPAVADLAAMRDATQTLGGKPNRINPKCAVDLVIDHSVQVDTFGTQQAFNQNVKLEMSRNLDRYGFLRWGQQAFQHFRVVPPGTGICHQVNLEYLARVVWSHKEDGKLWAYPDTVVGTDSHTTMINGLGVLGWGVGGIEAEAAMLGQPISMLIPDVIGVKLTGSLREGVTATDLVLTVTHLLRKKGVVDKFVEFFGPGLKHLPLADRATIANMAPEYGATCGLFPIDQITLNYLELSGRDENTIALVKAYAQAQGMWHDEHSKDARYTDILNLDLASIEPSVAGPKRPQDKVRLADLKQITDDAITQAGKASEQHSEFDADSCKLHHGDVVIAAITSCTNTSNPSVMLAAGLLARNAVKHELKVKPWVKTSLAPGSKVVTDYLHATGLIKDLEQLGFYLVGYGCTTCIGNSGPLPDNISQAISKNDIVAGAVLSGNRNFEGRVHPQVKANWLASPPLVVAFAIAGTTRINLEAEPIGHNTQGQAVYLKDIWPSQHDLHAAMQTINANMFRASYADVFSGDQTWQTISIPSGETFTWEGHSTYVKCPPFFNDMKRTPAPIQNIHHARVLALLGDSITTDHISPAGSIKSDSPAGIYLKAQGISPADFNSYGARRGNHEVMMRGTFANIRIRNEMAPGTEGGVTTYQPNGELMSIYDAAMQYQAANVPLVIVAGKEYGTGSSRDWAAKGTLLLGVKAVIAESFERIHRSNLIGMGVLPLTFKNGTTRKTLNLDGSEKFSVSGIDDNMQPSATLTATIERADGSKETVELLSRIDTQNELAYYQHGGILQYVLRNMNQAA